MTRTITRNRFRCTAGAIAVGALALAAAAGCSSSSTSTAASTSAAKVTLVVYSAQGYDQAMTTAFHKATGIPVKLDDNSTGPLLTQIEASKNNPNWGLLWVDGATAFAGLDQQGLLQKGLEPKADWNSLGQQSLPADKSYTPTGVTLMAALVYNKTKVTDPPATGQQLLEPQWKGDVGMNDPSQSGPTYPFIAGMMNYLGGVNNGESYFTKLKSNGLIIHPTNGPTLQALTSGQIKLALVQSSAGIGAVLGDKQLAVKYLDPVTLLPSAIGIDAKAPAAERAEAEKFIEFVLSPAGQKVMQSGDPTGDSLYYPVLQGVSPLSSLPSLASVQTQTINPYTWGRRKRPSTRGSTARSSADASGPPGPASGAGRADGVGRPAGQAAVLAAACLHDPDPVRRIAGPHDLAAALRPGHAVVHALLPARRVHRGDRHRDHQLAVGERRGRGPWRRGRPPGRLAGRPHHAARAPVRGRRDAAGAAAAVVAARAGVAAAGAAGRRHVPAWPRPARCHARDHGAVRRRPAARPALGAVLVPRRHRRPGRTGAGVRGRGSGARRQPDRGAAADPADARPRALVRAGDRVRGVDQRLRGGGHARVQLQLLPRHVPAVSGHRQLPAELPGRLGHGLPAGRRRGHPARAAGQGAARAFLPDAVRADQAGRAAPAVAAGRGVRGRRGGAVLRCGARRARLRRGKRIAARRLWRLVFADPGQLPRRAARVGPARPAGTVAGVRRHRRLGDRGRRVHRRLAARPAAGHVVPGAQSARLPAAVRDRAAQRGVRGRLHLLLQPASAVPAGRRPLPDDDAAGDRVHRVEPADQLPGADGRGLGAAAVAEGRNAEERQRRADRVGQGRAAGGLPAAGDGLAAHVLRRVPRAPDLPAALRAGLAAGLGRDPGQPRQLPLRRRHGPVRAGGGRRDARRRGGTRRLPAAGAGRLAQDRRREEWLSGSRSTG